MPYFMFHDHQSFRRASSSSSIRQHVNLVEEIDEQNIFLKTLLDKYLDVLNANYALYQSFRRALSSSSIRQHINLVEEIDEKNIF